MRAHVTLADVVNTYNIDNIHLRNKETKEDLKLSFREHNCYNILNLVEIESQDEETETYGLPDSLKGKLGNNKETYDYVKDCEVISVSLCLIGDLDVSTNKEEFNLVSLEIDIGEDFIDYTESKDIKVNIIE